MKLERKDYTFNNPSICHIMPKHIELDRVLINLYMLLKYQGRRPVARTGRIAVTVDYVVEQLIKQHGDKLKGFGPYQEVVRDWVYSDLLDIVYRGIPDKEVVAAPLPLHLNAYKLRNPKQADDYRGAEHLYSMILAADPNLPGRLSQFLGQGMDPASYDTYDNETPLDLDTLAIVRMVDNPHLQERPSSRSTAVPEPPLCLGQARLYCSDLRRLLAYQGTIPRSVLIGYLRSASGLHLGLYLLRLFRQVAGWVRDEEAHPICLNCPVDPESANPFAACPYAFQNPRPEPGMLPELLIDMGEDFSSHMAELARADCTRHYASINDYIPAVFTLNQVFRYAESHSGQRDLRSHVSTVPDALRLLAHPPVGMDRYFDDRIDNLLPPEEADQERPEVRGIRGMQDLSPLETFVQLVALERTKYYRKYLVEQLDTVLTKNQETCLLRQGKGKRNERRWYLGSRLLEMLVQIAVLQPARTTLGSAFRSEPVLVDHFVTWLRERYGLVLMPQWPEATIEDYEAFNANMIALKDRLREIGFYTDLSDAYNAQTIRPRYAVRPDEQEVGPQ